jgi:hypothetical protein
LKQANTAAKKTAAAAAAADRRVDLIIAMVYDWENACSALLSIAASSAPLL